MKLQSLKSIGAGLLCFGKKNGPIILTGAAIAGLAVTAVMAYKAGLKSHDILEAHKDRVDDIVKNDELSKEEKEVQKKETYTETAKKLAPIVTGPILFGTLSAVCAFSSLKVSSRRIAALSAAYSIAGSTLQDMEGKMTEVLGKKKVGEIKDAVAKDKLQQEIVPPEKDIIVTGGGDVLCKDLYSGRFFYSSPEKIGQAIAWASSEVRACMYVSLNEFYDQLDLERIPLGDDIGWNVDDLEAGTLPIRYTAILTNDNRPCLCISTIIAVRDDFRNLH